MVDETADFLAILEQRITPGTIIPKPQARADFVIKGWGKRRGKRALIYTIPNHSNPGAPHQKGITSCEWTKAFRCLIESGSFSREWFTDHMGPCAREGGCNFTTIGGIFELLGFAHYDRPAYILNRLRSPTNGGSDIP